MSSTDPSGRGLRLAGILLLALGCLSLVGGAAKAAAQVPANGRAWELVTPGPTFGSVVDRPVGISADGDRLAYQTFGSIPGAAAGELVATNLAVRTASGWESTPQSLPVEIKRPVDFETFASPLVAAFDPDLSDTVRVSNSPLVPDGPEVPTTGIYRVEDGAVTLLASTEEEHFNEILQTFLGASDDLSHVVFQAKDHLLPSDAGRTSGKSIYEWAASGLRQVDVATDGSLLSECGSSVPMLNAVSRSGLRIFFTNPDSGCGLPKRIYLREDGSKTVEVSASHCNRPDCNAPQDAEFLRATPDGSMVFFSTAQQLVDEDEDEFRDLYRYDVESGTLELVSARAPGQTGMVKGPVRTAVDGSRVYFFAEGRLLPGLGEESKRNLYMADGAGLHFIAATGEVEPQDHQFRPLLVSRDGRFALLETTGALEASDTDGVADAYLYDAETGNLTRVSAGNGGNGPFEARLKDAVPRGAGRFERPVDAPFGGSLSEDGDRVFFTTEESLLPEDRNEVADVYEWTGGTLGLLSSGEGKDDAEFVGATADGKTALIRTSASLVPEDRDGGDYDLYAVRIGGGFPSAVSGAAAGCDSCAAGSGSVRPRVATAAPARSMARHIRLGKLDRRAVAQALQGGILRLRIHVSVPGKIVARARAPLGGRYRTAGRGLAGASRPGWVGLGLVMSPSARRVLRSRGSVRLLITLRQGELRLLRRLVVIAGGSR